MKKITKNKTTNLCVSTDVHKQVKTSKPHGFTLQAHTERIVELGLLVFSQKSEKQYQ